MAFPAFFVLLDLWVIQVFRAGVCRVHPHAGTLGWAQGTHPGTAGTRVVGDGLKKPQEGFDQLNYLLGQISSKKWLLQNRSKVKMGSYST